MLRNTDGGDLVEDQVVRRALAGEPSQAVSGALDLIALEAAIDDGNVDPRLAMGNAELVDDQSLPIACVLKLELALERLPNVKIEQLVLPGGVLTRAFAADGEHPTRCSPCIMPTAPPAPFLRVDLHPSSIDRGPRGCRFLASTRTLAQLRHALGLGAP